jgi:hypothetical protein
MAEQIEGAEAEAAVGADTVMTPGGRTTSKAGDP